MHRVFTHLSYLLVLTSANLLVDSSVRLRRWTWSCVDSQCVKVDSTDNAANIDLTEGNYTIDGCKSVCGKYGSLWPKPTQTCLIGSKLAFVKRQDITLSYEGALRDQIQKSFELFLHNLKLVCDEFGLETPEQAKPTNKLQVGIQVQSSSMTLNLRTNEAYDLNLHSKVGGDLQVNIQAETFFGARHGLETLSQLISFNDVTGTLQVPIAAQIVDEPVYPFRGILLDTGRNYFSVESMEKIIDGMSFDKFNVLHWHMNEMQSFPFVSNRVPELTEYGAYSRRELYTKSDVVHLAQYARQRGILLLPEFDAPAHAAYGWNFGEAKGLGSLVTCLVKDWIKEKTALGPEPPAGQLNPLNENVYNILSDLYLDLIEAFDLGDSLDMFHMGGDEVNFDCWATDPKIRQWMNSNGYNVDPKKDNEGYLQLWARFQAKAKDLLVKAHSGKEFKDGIVLWTSDLAGQNNIRRFLSNRTYVIQVWTKGTDFWIKNLLRGNYRVIMSNTDAWYLDCGYGAWVWSGHGKDNNWCSPWRGWKTMYMNSPKSMVENFGLDWMETKQLILGGEGAMWSEQVDEQAVEGKIWPRSSAIAERLWSEPESSWKDAEPRILEHRLRMVRRGIRADVIQPEFCRQNDGYCYALYFPLERWYENDLVRLMFFMAMAVFVWVKRRQIIMGVRGTLLVINTSWRARK